MSVCIPMERPPWVTPSSCETARGADLRSLIPNVNLDAICGLAALLRSYPNASKPERLILRRARDRLPDEAAVLLDEMTLAGLNWTAVTDENAWLIGRDRSSWIRDAVESAEAIGEATRKTVPIVLDDVVMDDRAGCARFIAAHNDNPKFHFDDPREVHVWLANWFAAKAVAATTVQLCAGFICDAAAHARPLASVRGRAGDRTRCRRRLVLRDVIASASR